MDRFESNRICAARGVRTFHCSERITGGGGGSLHFCQDVKLIKSVVFEIRIQELKLFGPRVVCMCVCVCYARRSRAMEVNSLFRENGKGSHASF